MHRLDQPLESSPPSAAERLEHKAAWSRRASLLASLLAIALFALTTFLLLGCLLTHTAPFAHRALVIYLTLAVPAIPLLALSSWVLSLRHVTLLRMADEKNASRET